MHIITDGNKVVRLIITKNNIGDSPAFREIFKSLKKELKKVDVLIADSAYDYWENFNMIAKCGIKPLIKVRKNYSSLAKGSPSRRNAVIEQKDPLWSKKIWLFEKMGRRIYILIHQKNFWRISFFTHILSWMKPSFLKKVLHKLLILISIFNAFHYL